MGRAPCCDKAKVKRGPWSPDEDATLKTYLQNHGTGGNWIALPHKAGLNRCGKSCRLRWLNYLRPDIKHGGFTEEEDNVIWTLYNNIGSRWSVIASQLPGRTDNDVKNYWNTKLKKKLAVAGKTSFNHPTTSSTTNNTTSDHDHHHLMSSAQFTGLLPKTETAADHHHVESSACFDANSSSTLKYMDHQNFDLQKPKLDYPPSDPFCHISNPVGLVSAFTGSNHGKASSPSMSSTLSTSSPLGFDSNFGSWDGNGINNGGDHMNEDGILMDLGFDSYNDSLISGFGF